MKNVTTLFFFIFATVFSVDAERYLVQTGATGDAKWTHTDSGTIVDLLEQNKTLNAFISTLSSNDEIWLCQGTYTLSAPIYLNKSGQQIFGGFSGAESTIIEREISDLDGNGIIEPWEFTNASIIDGAGNYRCISIQGDAQTSVNGIVVQNGKTTNGGAGIYLNKGNVLNSIIRNNLVTDCTANTAASGIQNISGIVNGCLIENNTTDTGNFYGYGGGIACSSSEAVIENSMVRYNEIKSTVATSVVGNNKGGGIYLQKGGSAWNCVVYNNTTPGNGGGIYLDKVTTEPFCSVYYCTVTNNKAGNQSGGIHTNASGIIKNTALWGNSSSQTANNNAFFYKSTQDPANNTDIDYIGFNGGIAYSNDIVHASHVVELSENGEIFSDPTETQGVPVATEEPGNWELTATSPLLNAGLTYEPIESDLLGTMRPQGPATDIGAYELLYYLLITRVGENGSVRLANGSVLPTTYNQPKGIQIELIVKPDNGYSAKAIYNGNDITSTIEGEKLVLPALQKNESLDITFEITSGIIEGDVDNTPICYAVNGGIMIKGISEPIGITVYKPSGEIMSIITAATGDNIIQMTEGIYLVRIGEKVSKVIVK
ncbi:choice-of-anchor Q domain-containing protein [Coprobacter sp.]